MTFMKKIIYSLLLIAALASCKKDDTLRYNNVTMGMIQGEDIISDQGNIFQITEKPFEYDLKKYESGRVLVVCDVLRETASKTYDVRLTGITGVLAKNVKTMEESTVEEDLSVDNPVIIRELWYAGGYLNMTLETAQKQDSKTKHYINLVQEASEENGKYVFSLRHNAQGETPSEGDKNYFGAVGYVSFPIAGVIKEDAAKIVLKWKSHKYTGCGYSLTESESKSQEYSWTRNGYEHVPGTPSLRNGAGLF